MILFSVLRRLKKDAKTRTEFFLKAGLTINILYAFYNIFTGVKYGSVWFFSVAVYYTMVCLIKFFLIVRGFSGGKRELLNLRTCGVMLLLLNITVSGLIVLMIIQNKSHVYSPWVILWAAGYTIFRITATIVEGIRLHKNINPTMRAVKSLNLTVALTSLFSLQASVLDLTKTESDLKQYLNVFTGSIVGVLVILIALRTILLADRYLRDEKHTIKRK
jgi:hypothetical protein